MLCFLASRQKNYKENFLTPKMCIPSSILNALKIILEIQNKMYGPSSIYDEGHKIFSYFLKLF
jgi:hypothetical protein